MRRTLILAGSLHGRVDRIRPVVDRRRAGPGADAGPAAGDNAGGHTGTASGRAAGPARRARPGSAWSPRWAAGGRSRRARRPRAGAHQARPGPRHDQGLPPRLHVQRTGHVLEPREGIRGLGHGNPDRHGVGHQEGQLQGRRPLAPLLRRHRAGQLHGRLEAGRRAEAGAAVVRPRRRQGARGRACVTRRQLQLARVRRDDWRLVPGPSLGHVRRPGHRRGPDLPGHAAHAEVPSGCSTRCTRRRRGRATRSTCCCGWTRRSSTT